MLEEHGGYLFLVADDARDAPTATAHIHLEQLLFVAAERLDRVAEIRRLIPDDLARPSAVAGVDLGDLSSHARLVMGHCDGVRSVREIASETRLGRFETLCALDALVRARRVELLAPRLDAGEAVRGLVDPFNESLDEIYGALSGRDLAAARQEVRHWAENGEHRELLAGALTGAGLVRSDTLTSRLVGGDPRRPLEEMEGALHELVAFALVAASTRLPRSAERDLSRRVHERLRRVPA